MFLPVEGMETSTLLGKYIINGNTEISNEIKEKVTEYAQSGKSLYDAQREIESYLKKKYSREWYENNDSECQFITEEIYNEIERNRTSNKFVKQNRGVLY